MRLRPQLRFVYGQIVWMLVLLITLTIFGVVKYDLFFMLSFVGFFVLTELTDPFIANPKLRRRFRFVALVGILVFGYLLTNRLWEVLLEELPNA